MTSSRRKLQYHENASAIAALSRWQTFMGPTIIIEAIR
jgi:hypothetical protein